MKHPLRRLGLWLILAGCIGSAGCTPSRGAVGVLNPNNLRPPPTAPEPVVNPGDVLRVTMWRGDEFSGELTVRADGSLTHPLLQDVRVAGLTVEQAKGRIIEALSVYNQDPQLIVEALYPVSVAGEVRDPRLYNVSPETTISQAIALAGGVTALGRRDRVRIVREGRAVDLDLTQENTLYGTIPLRSGDQIFVDRTRQFNFFRDALPAITSILSLGVSIISVIVILDRP